MNIDSLLEKWDFAKKEKALLEKDCERYKDAIERYMSKKDKDIISGENFIVSRRTNTRQQLSRQNVPPKIWERYCTRYTYKSYHLKKK
tara:strand:- start:889 stop:1152 length:264 start_codon:yes stop_codon:yes gene_type:complete